MKKTFSIAATLILIVSCAYAEVNEPYESANSELGYNIPNDSNKIISREDYANKLYGFWLGQNIANWTGLLTELVRIGNIGDIQSGEFYTREDWGGTTEPNYFGADYTWISPVIDFIFEDEGDVWGSDDDTDIEYIYQHLLYTHETSVLTPVQIRDGWLHHIYSRIEGSPFGKDRDGHYRNFLWVSNQRAYTLMEKQGLLPPHTGEPTNNELFDMIDAQLTTEIFGLFAPARPDIALKMAYLPIRTTAYENAAWISEFYVIMHSLASLADENLSMKDQILWMADKSRNHLPDHSYSAKMYDFVYSLYLDGVKWEDARDAVYTRYQVEEQDGYDLTSRDPRCKGCFSAGLNYAASLVSLFWGEGDFKETLKIAVLAGWDSDNPAATWGGLLGFMIGKQGIEEAFDRKFANKYNIHRTRRNFPNDGIDTFENMAETGLKIIDRVVREEMGGRIDLENAVWYIPGTEEINFQFK
jgi:hypothetical protein